MANRNIGDRLNAMQVGYTAEWALSKAIPGFEDDGVLRRWVLTAVCGRENTPLDAIVRLTRDMYARNRAVASTGSVKRNVAAQNESAAYLIAKLQKGELDYHNMNQIPSQAFDSVDALIIQTKNTTHVDWITEAIQQGKHAVCEKPLVRTLDDLGNPTRTQYDALMSTLASVPKSLVLMDAEHYSYKAASLTFYEKIDDILNGRQIRAIYGEVMEKDDPFHGRTMTILSPGNGTGLMGDTMCHLLAFISNLGGTSKPLSWSYSRYKGDFKGQHVDYEVDTYDVAEFEVSGSKNRRNGPQYIKDRARATFRVAKFIGLMKQPMQDESKYIEFTLDDNSKLRLDFRNGSVVETRGNDVRMYVPNYPVNGNEYASIMHHLYRSIMNGEKPTTDMLNSMMTMRAIIGAYELGGKNVEIYN